MLFLFGLTILLSASLLFVVQPMFARMILPSLGGSPAVWNTALVFFQIALLAGYGYVHGTSTWLSRRAQITVHCVLLVSVALFLPLGVPAWWSPPLDRNPVPALIGLLVASVGLPFFVVSTTGPLLQRWFADSRHRLAADPYFLYAASNVGSIAGLLSYPLLVEPGLGLGSQSLAWSAGFVALAGLTVACGLAALRGAGDGALDRAPALPASDATEPLTARRRLRWILLAFVPSSLMMGVTSHITTDIAAVPLLWVLPLALYLLSFVNVFARRPLISLPLASRVLPFLILPLLVIMTGRPAQPLLLIIGFHLAVLFFAAVVCHGAMANDRPAPNRLTEFYLWMAVGGALGGVFNALVAPMAFDFILEYPLALALACMLIPSWSPSPASTRSRVLDFVLPAIVALLMVATTWFLASKDPNATRSLVVLLVALLTLPIFSFKRRPLRFGLAVAAVLIASPADVAQRVHGLHAERSFFGLHRVLKDHKGRFHFLQHGSTIHGLQRVAPRASLEPLGYYGRSGPLGEVFHAVDSLGRARSVGVLGLGVGGIAAYAKSGQRWTYYEIDPVVARIAQDPRLFSFVGQAPASMRVVLGDGRLGLDRSSEKYDLLVLDAYSSDAIPVHLLTREAMDLYLRHLTRHGILVFHISNQYFNLAPVVAGLADEAGATCRVRFSGAISDSAAMNGMFSSVYAVVARTPADLGSLEHHPKWKAVPAEKRARPWTDDYSSLFSALEL